MQCSALASESLLVGYVAGVISFRAGWAAFVVLGALGLTSCAVAPASSAPSPSVTSSDGATDASPSPSRPVSTPTQSAALPTTDTISCDTMLDPAVDAQLRAEGLTPAPKPWTQFGFTPTAAALECPWGDPDSTQSQKYYAWAAFQPGERDAFVSLVEQNGYRTEDSAEGTWVLPPEDGSPHADGFLITNEWVVITDTRDQIHDIIWAR